MPSSKESLDKAGQTTTRRRLIHWSDAIIAAAIAAILPILASIGAGWYSTIQQCNRDASDLETRLTSILLEVSGREERMKTILAEGAGDKNQLSVAGDSVYSDLPLIESGAEGHVNDPAFKDHSLVDLVNQYNRLLRRVRFPDKFCPKDSSADCAKNGLLFDTQNVHAVIATQKLTAASANRFFQNVSDDLSKIAMQLDWHKQYGPVRLCSFLTLVHTNEPWRLIELKKREPEK
jgi:hypothetical protein